MPEAPKNGFLVIDKPGGMTSRDVLNRLQKTLPRKTKLGHAGTLDPLATGVLVVCVGTATRLTEYVQDMSKTYHSRFRLGARSTTDDADGEVSVNSDAVPPTREQIDVAIPAFLGVVSQVPPAFSALKLDGQRAYDLARKGEEVALAARPVRIDAIRVQNYEWPFLDVEIDCGKGTYIRSIARDLGDKLGCGGLVESLRRTRIGVFRVEIAIDLHADLETLKQNLMPLKMAIEGKTSLVLDEERVVRFQHGQFIPVELPPASADAKFAVFAIRHEGETIRPVLVFKD
jgi:tRNA pseudouridine55 synthase